MRGQIIIEEYQSRCLEGNPLGDPSLRRVPVYLPEGFATNRDWPLIVALSGFTGSGMSFLNWNAWQENFPERIERLIQQKKIPACVVIFPDCFTRYGGSQYLNSSATGDYEDHVTGELVPWARATFRAGLSPEQTVVAGKSSGGYGAFVLAARHPDLFGWALVHSADCYFEYGYAAEFPNALNELRKRGGPENFLKSLHDPRPKSKSWFSCIEITGMAACYSPNPNTALGFDYPFDLETGEIRADILARWLVHDPVRMAERDDIIANLKKLRGIYVECGLADEYHLHWGARILVSRLRKTGLTVEHREFDDGHMNINYRYDESLSWWGSQV